jgi:hypothetical protein
MSDEQYHRLVLELTSAAIQEFGWHAGEYPEGSEERQAYKALESKAHNLFHAAWDRTIDKSLEGYDQNMNKITDDCPMCDAPGQDTNCPSCRDYGCGSAYYCDAADFGSGGYRQSKACVRIMKFGGWEAQDE